jgi:hypothetical protein
MLSPDVEDILPENYMEGVHASTKGLTHTVLDRVVDLRIPKLASRTPSPREASRRSSSSASINGAANVVVKKEPTETPEKTISDQHTLTNSVGEAGSCLAEAASAEQVSRSANASEKQYSSPSPPARPSPVNPLASITKDVEVALNQALEQQCTLPLYLTNIDLRLIAEQKNLTLAADDRHESILKVVSSTLTTNVGKLLEQTVRNAIEKSILPAINTTVKKSVEQHLAKTFSNPLDKTLPKEMRSAVNDAVQRALLDTDGGIKFSDAVMKPVLAKLEYTIQRDLPTRLGMMFEKNLVPMMTKMEERMQLSIDKSMQRIQKESRVSQLETARKFEILTEAVINITDYLKMTTSPTVSPEITPAPVAIHPPAPPRRQTMAAHFKAKKFSAGIESVIPIC